MRKILVLLLVLFSVATFGQGEVLKQGQKVLKRSGKILKSHYPWEYNEPADWINIHYCPKDEILLVASDEGNRYVCYQALCNSNAQYKVDVYGGIKGDSLIYTNTYNYNQLFEYQLPLSKGKVCSLGYTTYKIRFYPATTNKIINFVPYKHTSSSNTNESILLANANCPTIKLFQINGFVSGVTTPRFKYVNLWNCTGLTSLKLAFVFCGSLECATLGKTMDNLTDLESAFNQSGIKKIKFPKYLNNVTNMRGVFYKCKLESLEMPQRMDKLNNIFSLSSGIIEDNYNIKKIQYPFNLDGVTSFYSANKNCTTMTYANLPQSAINATSTENWFYNNYAIRYLKLPRIMNKLTTTYGMIFNDTSLTTLILPDSMILCVNINNWLNVWKLDSISTSVWGIGQVVVGIFIRDLKTFIQPSLKVSKFILRGNTLATASQLHTINIDWANSTYGGTSPQIDIRWNSLSATTLDAIFTALPVVVGKTINVAGNPGSATCTPSIASLKGWTVIIL